MRKTKSLVVMKFGGAALSNGKNIINAAQITLNLSKSTKQIIIVSALQGVTDDLIDIKNLCERNKTKLMLHKLQKLQEYHQKILSGFGESLHVLETQQEIRTLTDLLKLYIVKNAGKKLTNAQHDYIVSFGERLSVHIFACALKELNSSVIAVDSSYFLKTTADFGNAKVVPDLNKATIHKIVTLALKQNAIPIITGYIGCGEDGCVTTLGRGGSDYSATSLASLMHADQIVLWKDVKGMYDKDPKQHKDALFLTKVNYHDAIDMSINGAKILHPESIIPAEKNSIPVYIKSFLQPNEEGTTIWKGKTLYA